jgi:hypothetical protein
MVDMEGAYACMALVAEGMPQADWAAVLLSSLRQRSLAALHAWCTPDWQALQGLSERLARRSIQEVPADASCHAAHVASIHRWAW